MPETRSLDENDPDAPVEDVEGHEVDDGRRHRRLVDVLKPGKQNKPNSKMPPVALRIRITFHELIPLRSADSLGVKF